jgi:hypothetical protein
MLATAETLEEVRSTQSHSDRKDLFQLLVDELRQTIPFDPMAQFDQAGNWVNWHFSEAYDSATARVSDIPKEETVAWEARDSGFAYRSLIEAGCPEFGSLPGPRHVRLLRYRNLPVHNRHSWF